MAVVPTFVVFLALVVVQIGFGGYGVLVKKFAASSKVNPLIFCLIRDACCWPVLQLCAIVAERRLNVPRLREVPLFFVMGFFGVFANQFFYIMGVYYVDASISSVFQPAIPVWTALLAIVTRIEKPPSLRQFYGWAKLIGIIMAVGGAVNMLTHKITHPTSSLSSSDITSHSFGSKTVLGIIFLVINTICMAIFLLIQKHYIFERSKRWAQYPISVTTWCYLFGALYMGMASFYYVGKCPRSESCHDNPWNIPQQAAIPLVYAIFVAAALCYMLLSWSNKHVSPSVVTAFWPVQVLVAVVLSYFLLDEYMTILDYVGAAFIIIGLVLVVYSNWYAEKLQKKHRRTEMLRHTEEDRHLSHSQSSTSTDDENVDPVTVKLLRSGSFQPH